MSFPQMFTIWIFHLDIQNEQLNFVEMASKKRALSSHCETAYSFISFVYNSAHQYCLRFAPFRFFFSCRSRTLLRFKWIVSIYSFSHFSIRGNSIHLESSSDFLGACLPGGMYRIRCSFLAMNALTSANCRISFAVVAIHFIFVQQSFSVQD